MKEVTELIEALQQRLKNAGGGEIIITDKKFLYFQGAFFHFLPRSVNSRLCEV